MLEPMGRAVSFFRSRRGKVALNAISVAIGLLVAALAARHFAEAGWPLAGADIPLMAAAGVLFLLAYAFKAYGWHRLFAPSDRPRTLTLATACGAASVSGAALPGRFDDAIRVAIVRRSRCSESGVATVCFSLFMLGLIDTAALMPLASAAAASPDTSAGVRVAMAIVAAAGFGAAILIAILPRIVESGRLIRFRITRWLGDRVTSPRDAWKSWILVLASWLVRAVALFLLLASFGISLSFTLAVVFLCAAAASGALPIAPAGAATQAGAGAAILVMSGISASQAIAFAIAAQALLIFAGAAVLIFAAACKGARRVLPARAA